MSRMTAQDAIQATQDCIDRCVEAEYPPTVMTEFFGELRSQGWHEADIRSVERHVQAVARAMVDDHARADWVAPFRHVCSTSAGV